MTTRSDSQTIEVPSTPMGATVMSDRIGDAMWLGAPETIDTKDLRAHAAHYADELALQILSSPQVSPMVDGELRARGFTEMAPRVTQEPKIEIGTADPASGYVYLDCLTVGPLQSPFPLGPRRLVAAGALVVHVGYVFINPALMGGIPATVFLGARPYRMTFQVWNRTTNVASTATATGTFPSPAPIVTPVLFIPATPPPAPASGLDLYEMCLTVDVGPNAQPFAAFNTWHYDPYGASGLFLPPEAPGFQKVPARYGVYDPTA